MAARARGDGPIGWCATCSAGHQVRRTEGATSGDGHSARCTRRQIGERGSGNGPQGGWRWRWWYPLAAGHIAGRMPGEATVRMRGWRVQAIGGGASKLGGHPLGGSIAQDAIDAAHRWSGGISADTCKAGLRNYRAVEDRDQKLKATADQSAFNLRPRISCNYVEHSPSEIRRSRISQAKIVGFSRLYCSILETTVGVATLGFEPPIKPGGRSEPARIRAQFQLNYETMDL